MCAYGFLNFVSKFQNEKNKNKMNEKWIVSLNADTQNLQVALLSLSQFWVKTFCHINWTNLLMMVLIVLIPLNCNVRHMCQDDKHAVCPLRILFFCIHYLFSFNSHAVNFVFIIDSELTWKEGTGSKQSFTMNFDELTIILFFFCVSVFNDIYFWWEKDREKN